MKCHCGKPALCQVNNKGYCRDHRDEAIRAQAKTIREKDAGMAERDWIHRQIHGGRRLGRNVDAKEREKAREREGSAR